MPWTTVLILHAGVHILQEPETLFVPEHKGKIKLAKYRRDLQQGSFIGIRKILIWGRGEEFSQIKIF